MIVSNFVERAKRKVVQIQAAVEACLVFPLLRGCDIGRWTAAPSIQLILTHQEGQRLNAIPVDVMERDYPKCHSYLKRFEDILRQRKTQVIRHLMQKGPFYSIFGIGDYTFARWKVVWREVGNELDAAVIGVTELEDVRKPTIPDHTCVAVSCDTAVEAHFFCAAINSSPARLAIRNYIVLHPDPHVLNNINIPKFSKSNRTHARLAEFSEAAHKAAAKGEAAEVKRIEEQIDLGAAKLWGLSDDDLAEIKRSLEEA